MLFQKYSGRKSCRISLTQSQNESCLKVLWLPTRIKLWCIFSCILFTIFTTEASFSIYIEDIYNSQCNSTNSNKSITFVESQLKNMTLTFCSSIPAMFVMPPFTTNSTNNTISFTQKNGTLRISNSITCKELGKMYELSTIFNETYQAYQDVLNRTDDCNKMEDRCSTCLEKYKDWLCTQLPFSIDGKMLIPNRNEESQVCLECPGTEPDDDCSFGGYLLFTCQIEAEDVPDSDCVSSQCLNDLYESIR